MTRKRRRDSAAKGKRNSDCVVPPALPHDALPALLFRRDDEETDRIASYVEWQARDETVTHAEKISTEHVMGQQYEAWDVHTDKGRWWVITPPTNLYSQALMPSLDYTLSFHIGLMARFMSQQKPRVPGVEQALIRSAWRRWEQAAEALDEADEAEEFQAVGMRCRESMIAMAKKLGRAEMVPAGEEAPQAANVDKWCELIAGHVAHGSSAERVRKYLRDIGKDAWQLVNWLTHAANATRADAIFAVEATEHVLAMFGTAMFRQARGIPDRCPECGSYKVGLRRAPDTDDGSAEVPACLVCEWVGVSATPTSATPGADSAARH
jgi:hypothetical protein